MTGTLVSLVAVTLGFVALLVWVYRPRARNQWEQFGRLLFEEHDDHE